MTHGSGKDKIKGKAKEAMGKLTGNRRKEAEGRIEQAKGEAKKKMSGGRDRTPPQPPPAL
ncbi:CsbD family protein [Streptomyces sp. ML-6]|uniref:CsbD family protein n=1 Tax=unclassified Streptomyces TaxID=2593676 RepID=UPI0024C03F1C|nr:CsbD family protein [Streptomyces sp. ML-6]MDK0523677.1 CsbD family protein [Streptomyces sp. ML-6]